MKKDNLMKKQFTTLLIISALFTPLTFAETGKVDTPDTRRTAAARYLKSGTLQSEIDGMMNAMVRQFGVPADLHTMVQTLQKSLDMTQLENVMEDKLIEHFTTDELNAMANFYGSETGRAIDRKMPQFTAETLQAMLPILQEAFVKAGEALDAQQKAKQAPVLPPAAPSNAGDGKGDTLPR